ncbi:MAG: ArnT family glycosyltransferase [Candidatus Binatia bacterium]
MTETSSPRLLAVVLLLATVLIFYNLGGGSLKDWDEAYTAERAREILVFHDWVTIHWNYRPDFVKPPLYYWLTALVYQIIGVSEFATRLWSALFGLLGFYAVYRLGKVIFSVQVGVIAAALLLTVTYYLQSARTAMLDTGLLSFGVLGLCAFLSHAFLLGWTLLGIGFMLKGPWVLFYLLPLPFWWLTQRQWDVLRNPRLYLGAALFLAIVLPWHLSQYALHDQAFFNSYVGYQIAARIQQPIEGHEHDVLFYLKRLSDKWHVWIYWFLIGHLVVGWRRKEGRKLAFLDLWVLTILLILTFVIKTKITEYSMLLYPAIAVMVSYFILYALEQLRWGKRLVIVSGTVSLALFFSLYDCTLDFNPEVKALGQVVQRHAAGSQPIVTFSTMQPVMVFYCRRPVHWVRQAELLPQVLQSGSLLIRKKSVAPPSLEPYGLTFHSLFEGPKYSLVALSRAHSR